jgi:hypothetical protein
MLNKHKKKKDSTPRSIQTPTTELINYPKSSIFAKRLKQISLSHSISFLPRLLTSTTQSISHPKLT